MGYAPANCVNLTWNMIELDSGRIHVRRAKNGVDSTHPLTGKEIRALRQLRRENLQSRFVFNTERCGPVTRAWFLKMVRRTGELAKPLGQLRHTPCISQTANAWLGSKIATGFRRLSRAKVATRAACVMRSPQRLCGIYSRDGGWEFPAALRHVPPGTRTVLGLTIRRPPTLIGQATVPAHSHTKFISRPAL
jgi:hypothetical protein